MVEPATESSSTTGTGFEPSIDTRTVILTGVVILGVVAAIILGVFLFRKVLPVTRIRVPAPLRSLSDTAPLPGLQNSPRADLQAFNQDKQRRLHSYGWVDRPRRIVHIPIERAIEMMTQHEAKR